MKRAVSPSYCVQMKPIDVLDTLKTGRKQATHVRLVTHTHIDRNKHTHIIIVYRVDTSPSTKKERERENERKLERMY